MGHRKNVGRALAGILAVGMLVSSMPSAVYAVENENSAAVVEEQRTVTLEEEAKEAGVEKVSVGKGETEVGQESAGTEAFGNEEAEAGKGTAAPADTIPKEEEDKGEQE